MSLKQNPAICRRFQETKMVTKSDQKRQEQTGLLEFMAASTDLRWVQSVVESLGRCLMRLLTALLAIVALSEDPRIFRYVALWTLRATGASHGEIEDLDRLAWRESRWRPKAVSKKGACGPWQQRPQFARPPTTCERLRRDPIHAARVALASYRQHKRICGKHWLVCYQYGPYHPKARKLRRL